MLISFGQLWLSPSADVSSDISNFYYPDNGYIRTFVF